MKVVWVALLTVLLCGCSAMIREDDNIKRYGIKEDVAKELLEKVDNATDKTAIEIEVRKK